MIIAKLIALVMSLMLTTAASAPTAAPAFSHVFLIVMENHEYSQIIGNSQAPYINSLASTYGLATNYTAVSHPSEPNYLALWSGSTQGVLDDGVYNFTAPTLGSQLETAGKGWDVAAQNVPGNCFIGASASGGIDGSGTYVRKHEPAISFTAVSSDPTRCARITNFTSFSTKLGSLWFIVPNMCNDMHDCSVATGDNFLRGFVPKILNSHDYRRGGLLVITFDEGTTATGGGGKVATIVISPTGKRAFKSTLAYNHYSLLRTIENGLGVPCLANSCSAVAMDDFWP